MKIVFTRHPLTDAQDRDLRAAPGGVGYLHRADLANIEITNMYDATAIVAELCRMFSRRPKDDLLCELYGVFPAPIRHALLTLDIMHVGLGGGSAIVALYESFNIQRSVEGQKPTFEYAGWLVTGYFEIPELSFS